MELQTIGVIGAGIMGSGVSLNLAQTYHRVILVDTSLEVLNKSSEKIREVIRMQKLFSKSDNIPSSEEVLDRIKFTTDYELLNEVDFVIENVTESWTVKAEVYPKLDKICSKDCVFAANTSTILIT